MISGNGMVLVLVAVAATGLAGYFGWREYQRQLGAAEATRAIVERSKQEGARNALASDKEHERASAVSDALKRLRDDPATCPACGR